MVFHNDIRKLKPVARCSGVCAVHRDEIVGLLSCQPGKNGTVTMATESTKAQIRLSGREEEEDEGEDEEEGEDEGG